MKGYTINKSIDLLEAEVEDLKGSQAGGTAADISYDNTSSHLTADDVQEAIDELNAKIPAPYSDNYSTTETEIGTYLGETLYRKVINVTGFTSNQVIVANQMYYGSFALGDYISGVSMAFADILHSYLDINGAKRGIVFQQYEPDTGNMTLGTQFERTSVDIVLVVEYTKTAAEAKKNKKK